MTKIIGLFPLTGNGGIASWTKKFLSSFPDYEFSYYPVDVSPKEHDVTAIFARIMTGMSVMWRIRKEVEEILKKERIDVLHTTTSGNIGSLRDLMIARLCKSYGVKSIMHCRYGCIVEDYQSKGLVGILLRKSMSLFDQIWVLDSRSYNFLIQQPSLKRKVHLTPNSIEVSNIYDSTPKQYTSIAFIGNLIPSKGLYELAEAVTKCKANLHIIGPGEDVVNNKLKSIVGNLLDKTVFIHGKMPNKEAVDFMRKVDIVALPTYFPSEAFPISILEAMSLSKLVISCPRAAIKDMLTANDGTECGLLVTPKSVDEIVTAIEWCQANSSKADEMCKKAFEKVYSCYRTEVIYDIYRQNIRELVSAD